MEESSEFLELIKKHKLSVEDCDKKVSDAHLETISRSSCKHWERLPSHLEMDDIVVSDIRRKQIDEDGKRLEFFCKWRDKKGSKATYKQLVLALLKIECRDDAEKVCEILKKSQNHESPPAQGQNLKLIPIESLDKNTKANLKLKLQKDLDDIMTQYSFYVRSIRKALQAKGVSAKDLSTDLQAMHAFNHTKQEIRLLSDHQDELRSAKDLNDIFDLLNKEYASFLNFGIFKKILEINEIDDGREEFKYPDRLQTYIKKLNISEFFSINSSLKKRQCGAQLNVKIDINSVSKLAKVIEVKQELARILDINYDGLQLVDIEEGCVVATFRIPKKVAEIVFNKDSSIILTEEQKRDFRALPVMWIQYNGSKVEFGGKDGDSKEAEGDCSRHGDTNPPLSMNTYEVKECISSSKVKDLDDPKTLHTKPQRSKRNEGAHPTYLITHEKKMLRPKKSFTENVIIETSGTKTFCKPGGDMKLISESHCEDEGQLCEEPRQPTNTYRGQTTTLDKMERLQDADEVRQKQLTGPRTQGTYQNKMLTPKKIFTGKDHFCELKATKIKCTQTKKSVKKTTQHEVWFSSKNKKRRTETLIKQMDVGFLLEELYDCTSKWEEIGLMLGFVDGELKNIAHPTSKQHCMKELLVRWAHWPTSDHLRDPTLESLCDALRSKVVGLGDVADKLDLKRNSLPSQTTSK